MNHSQNIPFLDLVTPHVELEKELTAVFQQVIRTAGFIGGPMVENFEKEFAAFCQTERSVAVNSGTDALRFALMAAGVKQGDVVVTVAHTFIATTEAISQAGALPEFVDIDERTYNMDAAKLRDVSELWCTVSEEGKLVSKRSNRPVTAIVPVHLYGQMADMDAILELAEQYRSDRDRGRVPGARRGVLLAQTRSLVPGRFDGTRGRVQLLPWQKSGCLRRRRRDHHERFEASRHMQDDSGSWPGEEVLPRYRGIQRKTRFHANRIPEREAQASRRMERKTPREGSGVQPSLRRCRSRSRNSVRTLLVARRISPVRRSRPKIAKA